MSRVSRQGAAVCLSAEFSFGLVPLPTLCPVFVPREHNKNVMSLSSVTLCGQQDRPGSKGAKCGQLVSPGSWHFYCLSFLPANIIFCFQFAVLLGAFVLLFFARHYFDFNISFVCFSAEGLREILVYGSPFRTLPTGLN